MGLGLGLVGRRRDGSEVPLEISLSPLDTPGSSRVIAAVRDVTERRANAEGQFADRVAAAEFQVGQDLVDGVIRTLFGSGLQLQSVLARVDADAQHRIQVALDGIDTAVRSMRDMIFNLGDAITRKPDRAAGSADSSRDARNP